MTHHRFSLILACLLLCGCAGPHTPAQALPSQEAPPPPLCSYDPDDPAQQQTRGAVRAYPLNVPDAVGLWSMGESVLLLYGEDSASLALLSGTGLEETAACSLGISRAQAASSLQILDDGLSLWDPLTKETLVMDGSLREIRQISPPPGLTGMPVLSPDGVSLYYCTSDALRVMDVASGASRCIRETGAPLEGILALHGDGSILVCQQSGSTSQYISAETGRLLGESGDIRLQTFEDRYYAALPAGMTEVLLFGSGEGGPQVLTPKELTGRFFFLKAQHGVVTASAPSPGLLRLEHYDLATGRRRATVTFSSSRLPEEVVEAGGAVWILTEDCLYRWDMEKSPLDDPAVYTGPRYTADAPDIQGLAQCRARAEEIGQTYGIRILIGADAAAAAPEGSRFEEEYLVPVIEYQLDVLSEQLSQFPQGMLQTTASNFGSLTVCLVRSISETADAWIENSGAYIPLAAGEDMAQALFHSLYHVMETQILTHSIALDQWEKLNPKGFSYDLSFEKNSRRDGAAYLLPETRAFIDAASMAFPREDRAVIWENACTPGMESCFQSEPMQAKLRALCRGIREAYGLKDGPYFWEQYLMVPLA